MRLSSRFIERLFRVFKINAVTMFAGIFFLLIVCKVNVAGSHGHVETNTDSYLNTMQIIQKHGYPAEAHTVETADGYLLTMHRIPSGKQPQQPKQNGSNSKTPPIFIQHGFLGSSADFILIGSNSLAFLLADQGYDVWLGNVRGNTYSRGHVTLFPNEKQFWNFTWHQSAVYDIPAQVDFICNYTKQQKLVYIGFSMGTTVFFALTSTMPQYNNKFELSLLMAPVAFLANIKSPLLRILAFFSDNAKIIDEFLASGEFLPNSKIIKFLGKIFCEKNDLERSLCMSAIFMLVGSDPKEFDKNLMSVLINHYPSGYSVKALNHYSQLYKSGKFRRYDYGEKRNMLEYGSPTPPTYNLSLINTPMYFYEGKNDYLATPKDIKHLAKKLSTLRKLHVIDYPKFSHMDFLISLDVKKFVYDLLIEDLTSFFSSRDNF